MNDSDLGRETVEFDDGVLPVVAQDADSDAVLMVAYATPEAVAETLDTGYAHYYSRSRESLWRKGATSGHTQRIRDVLIDCDGDTLLYRVEQAGGACHTGHYSCFHRSIQGLDAKATSVTEPGTDIEIGADVRRVSERTFDPEDVYGGV